MKYLMLFLVLSMFGCGRKQGPMGPAGAAGPQGIQGEAGQDGTVITPEQLCPGATVYPSVFPEYALCIEGKVYGVYSANGGFLTYFPEGYYNSSGIGSACSFTIAANCEIIN